MAVKRRVGLRIDPYQRARSVEKGRKQGTENGLGAARVKSKSAKSATGAPVKASGCKQRAGRKRRRRSFEAAVREGAVKQGGTTEALRSRPCRADAR